MRVAISLRLAQTDWAEASAYVTEAERLGADFVWSAEAWGHDGVTPLAFVAARTSRIRLGTGILQAGTRTPALLAMTAMSLSAPDPGSRRCTTPPSPPRPAVACCRASSRARSPGSPAAADASSASRVGTAAPAWLARSAD